jgi:hypothetical protein
VLFDLRSGRRRRAVQIVYSLLAVSFLIGFVLFGIGSGGIGSISDLFGGGGGGSTSSAYDSQINHARAQLKKDPKNEQALRNLARYEFLAGQTGVSQTTPTSPTQTVSNEAQANYSQAVGAWARYVKLAKKPDPALASQIAQAYAFLGDLNGAARAQRIFATAQPSGFSYGQLADYLYRSLQIGAGDAAARKAVAHAHGAQAKQIKSLLAKEASQVRKFKRQQAKATKAAQSAGGSRSAGSSQLQNPFSGIAPSTTPTAP